MSIEEEYRHLQHSTVRRTEVTIRTEEKQGNCAGGGGSYRETSLRCPTTNTAVAVVAGDGAAADAAGAGSGGGDGDEQQVI